MKEFKEQLLPEKQLPCKEWPLNKRKKFSEFHASSFVENYDVGAELVNTCNVEIKDQAGQLNPFLKVFMQQLFQ